MTRDERARSSTKGEQSELMPRRGQQPTHDVLASLSPVSQNRSANAPPLSGSSYSVELHIEELGLHGFAASERYRIGEAIERELTRLITEQGAPPSIANNIERAQMDAGAFNVAPSSNAETIGIQIARVLYGGIT